MVCCDEWDSMRLYAMVCDFNAMVCYGVYCKRYTWTDCISSFQSVLSARKICQSFVAIIQPMVNNGSLWWG